MNVTYQSSQHHNFSVSFSKSLSFLFFSFFLLFYSSLSVSSPHLSSLSLLSVHSTFHLQRFEYIYIYILTYNYRA